MPDDVSVEIKVRKRLSKQMSKINKRYLFYKNNPYLPKNIHQLRVNIRKMRSFLNFFKPLLATKKYQELNEALKELANKIGPIREIDVLIEECNKIAKSQPELIGNYADVFRFLEKERLQLIKYASTKKAFIQYEETLTGIEEILDTLELSSENTSEVNIEAFIEKRFEQKINKLKKHYRDLDYNDYENVHDVRKQAKKLRYTIKGFKKWLPKKDYKVISKKTKSIQEKLGIITDVHVNLELLKKYKNSTNNDELTEAFESILNNYAMNNSG
jgi:CHAD domain-containing protein